MTPQDGVSVCAMDGANSRSGEYPRGMPSFFWTPDDADASRSDLKFRIPLQLKNALESIAAIETQVRTEKNPKRPSEVSLNKLLISMAEKFVVGWCEEYGVKDLPEAPKKRGESPSEDVVRVARAVHAQREREERKKK